MEIIKKRIADMERAEYNPRVELLTLRSLSAVARTHGRPLDALPRGVERR